MSNTVENARRFLESLQRHDLAKLLSQAQVESAIDSDWWNTVIVRVPRPFDEAIRLLSPQDRKRIAEAVVSDEATVSTPADISCHPLEGPVIEGIPALLPELIIQKQTMIAVATGERRIQDVEDYYNARQLRLKSGCAAAGIAYDNPHDDLWQWFSFYKEHFGSYAERRRYITDLFRAPLAAASTRLSSPGAEREPTGWERVDRGLAKARGQLDLAVAEEDFQAIGLLCREVIISLAQAVYDPAVHVPVDGVAPSRTDANRMLEAYLHHVFSGESYKEVRAHARAAMALALNVQHRRTATRQLAALCLEAAASTAAVIAILSERSSAKPKDMEAVAMP